MKSTTLLFTTLFTLSLPTLSVANDLSGRIVCDSPTALFNLGPGYHEIELNCRDGDTNEPLDASDGLRYNFSYWFKATDEDASRNEPNCSINLNGNIVCGYGPQESNKILIKVFPGQITPFWGANDITGCREEFFNSTGECVPPPPLTPQFKNVNSASVETGDLISSNSNTLAGLSLVSGSETQGSKLAALNAGSVYAGGTISKVDGLSSFTPKKGTQLVVHFDTAFSPDGYDIDSMTILSADNGGTVQSFDVEVKRLDDPGFVPLQSIRPDLQALKPTVKVVTCPPFDPGGTTTQENDSNKELETTLTFTGESLFIPTGVESIRITFHEATPYREIDVIGEPSGDVNACSPPTDIEVCQISYGTARRLLVPWQNAQSYDEVEVYFDDVENSLRDEAIEEQGIVLQIGSEIPDGDHTIGVLGDCGPMDSGLVTQTFEVASESPHADPISGDVQCEFDEQFNGTMKASWTIDDPSDFVHVSIARGNDRFFVGRLDGDLTEVEVINTFATDTIVLQFFRTVNNGCYGSELIECQPDLPGIRFIRGDCDGNGTFGGTPTEAIVGLTFTFRGGTEPPCLAACDAEANGTLNITDYVRILRSAFVGLGEPDPPFPDCGPGTETDLMLGCKNPADECL